MQNKMNVGIYLRLSRDDKNYKSESISIGNQRDVLIQSVSEKGWNLVDEYADDGYTGTNFDRPEFNRLKADIESGRINCVITTDCSRLGRNSSMTGYYIGTYFAEKSVRYISVYDNIDTEKGYNQMVSIYLAIHEMYPGQISVKVRDVKKRKAQRGEFIGSQAPFGYVKSDTNRNQLVVDEFAAKIVNRIFTEYVNGCSGRGIADKLNQDSISTPSVYFAETVAKRAPKQKNSWTSGTVMAILKRRAYIGDMVQGTREVVSFLVNKRRSIDEADWIIVENTHEAIISTSLFEQVQERIGKNSRHRMKNTVCEGEVKQRREAILNGVAFCTECGAPMTAAFIGKQKIFTYRCRKYVQCGTSACSSHSIRADEIESYILSDIREQARLSKMEQKSMVNTILQQLKKETSSNEKLLVPRISVLEKSIEETNFTISQLFKEKITGKMPEKIFYTLMSEYEQDLARYEKDLRTSKKTLATETRKQENVSIWAKEIRSYLNVKSIDRAMIMNLVERVEVSDKKLDGISDMQVSIFYKFADTFYNKTEKIA